MIKPEGRGFNSHPGQSFPLSLCGPISICRANAHMVYGLKHQHFTIHSITPLKQQDFKEHYYNKIMLHGKRYRFLVTLAPDLTKTCSQITEHSEKKGKQ